MVVSWRCGDRLFEGCIVDALDEDLIARGPIRGKVHARAVTGPYRIEAPLVLHGKRSGQVAAEVDEPDRKMTVPAAMVLISGAPVVGRKLDTPSVHHHAYGAELPARAIEPGALALFGRAAKD